MDGSDKKLDNLKKAIAAKKANQSTSNALPPKDDPSYEMGTRRSSGIPVDLNDPEGNVRKFGRTFTAPKGRTATSFSMGRKRGK
jgi:hypothetical protein